MRVCIADLGGKRLAAAAAEVAAAAPDSAEGGLGGVAHVSHADPGAGGEAAGRAPVCGTGVLK
jgi:hypothetical protein